MIRQSNLHSRPHFWGGGEDDNGDPPRPGLYLYLANNNGNSSSIYTFSTASWQWREMYRCQDFQMWFWTWWNTFFFFTNYPSLLVYGRQTSKRKISTEMCKLALWWNKGQVNTQMKLQVQFCSSLEEASIYLENIFQSMAYKN